MKSKVIINENNHNKKHVQTDHDMFTEFYANLINTYEYKIKKLLIMVVILTTMLGMALTALVAQFLSGILICVY